MSNDNVTKTNRAEIQSTDSANETLPLSNTRESDTNILEAQLIESNQKFYHALRTCSIRSMDEVWSQTDQVVCIHPGWLPLKGWTQIRESWSRIFQNTHMHQVTTQVLEVQIHNAIGWLTCIEQIGVYHGDRVHMAYGLSTNIYQRIGNTWKLILHHGSPMPQPTTQHVDD